MAVSGVLRRVRATLLAVTMVAAFPPAVSAAPPTLMGPTGEISSDLVVQLVAAQPGDMITVIVQLRDRASLDAAKAMANRGDRQRAVVAALRSKAIASQAQLRAFLKRAQQAGSVSDVTPLWVQNAIVVTATPTMIEQLAARTDVSMVTPDAVTIVATGTPTAPPEPNIAQINAPPIWSLGHDGEGVIVASLDSGVDVTHPDLAASYRGGTGSWFDPFGQHPAGPMDASGHGTATMGIIVGGDAGGTTIGVAPGSTWMAARVFDDNGNSSASAIHLALQWTLDPDNNPGTADSPAVVNNSWAFGTPGCNLEFQGDLQALRAAGILPVFSAGNYGSGVATSVSPANYPEALAVGAVSGNDKIWASSSRGPSACGEASSTYPDLVAPGVSIWSSALFGLYSYSSGTSNAAPAVTGALALLLSTPGATTATAESALLSTAVDLGTAGPDNKFGQGRINVAAAYAALNTTPPPTTTTPTTTEPPTTTTEPSTTTTTEPPTTTTTTTTTEPPTTTTSTTTTSSTTTMPATTTTVSGPADLLFADGFESGSTSAWTTGATNSGRLTVTPAAALAGASGLSAAIVNRTAMYVSDATPNSATSYHARFRFDPNSVTMLNGKLHTILAALSSAGSETAAVELRYSSGLYQVRGRARRDNGQSTTTAWSTVTDAPHTIEIGWAAATSGSNGSMQLWVDGLPVASASGIPNGAQRIDDARLGPQAIPSGVSGTEYFDDFVSTVSSYIGG